MAITILNVIRDLGPTKKGGSGSHYFLCEDENEYVVKFSDSTLKTTTNELAAGAIAIKLKLPTSQIILVNLPEVIILESTDDLRNRKIQPGLHIGFKKLPDKTWDFDYWKDEMWKTKTLVNKDDLYGVVSFDNWLLNTDRNNSGNNMLQILSDNEIRYWMVDFSHCFLHNNWTEVELKGKKDQQELVDIFPFIQNQINKFEDFDKWLQAIENFKDLEIDYIVNVIPRNWPLSDSERKTMLEIVKHRKGLVRKNITNNREKLNLGN